VCVPCTTGRFGNISGIGSCIDCPTGFAQPLEQQTECEPCPTTRFAAFEGSTECRPCLPGSFANVTASTTCKPCPPGTFQPAEGQLACRPCPIGFNSDPLQRDQCKQCPAGTICNETGLSPETRYTCPKDFFSPVAGETNSDACQRCPPRQFTDGVGSAACKKCAFGQFFTEFGCKECPKEGATCSDGLVTTLPDFYLTRDGNGDVSIYVCPPGLCLGNEQCGANRKASDLNPLCGQCEEGYSYAATLCIECKQTNWALIFGFLIFLWLVVLVLRNESRRKPFETSFVRILCYFIQIAVLLLGVRTIWSSFLSLFNLNLGDLVSVTGVNETCVAPVGPYGNIAISIFAQLGMVGILAFHMLYSFAYHRRNFPAWDFFRTLCNIWIFIYVPMADVVFRFLDCVDVSGIRVVRSLPAVMCDSTSYKQWAAVSIFLMVTVLIACPLVLAWWLIKLARTPFQDSKGSYERNGKRSKEKNVQLYLIDTLAVKARWGVFFERLKPNLYFWEVLALFRRLVIVIFNALVIELGARFALSAIFQLGFVGLHIYFQPYLTHEENVIDGVSLVALLCLTFSIGMYRDNTSTFVAQTTFVLVVFLPIFAFMLYSAYVRYRSNRLRFVRLLQHLVDKHYDAMDVAELMSGRAGKRAVPLKLNRARLEQTYQAYVSPSSSDQNLVEGSRSSAQFLATTSAQGMRKDIVHSQSMGLSKRADGASLPSLARQRASDEVDVDEKYSERKAPHPNKVSPAPVRPAPRPTPTSLFRRAAVPGRLESQNAGEASSSSRSKESVSDSDASVPNQQPNDLSESEFESSASGSDDDPRPTLTNPTSAPGGSKSLFATSRLTRR